MTKEKQGICRETSDQNVDITEGLTETSGQWLNVAFTGREHEKSTCVFQMELSSKSSTDIL